MRKRALAIWPRKKEPEIRPPFEEWNQEEEVQKLRLQANNKPNPREKLQELVPGLDLKRLVP